VNVRGRPLRFGVQLQAQRTDWAEYARAIQAVEELGFDTLWTFDHMLPFSGPDDGAAFETLTTMGAMAALTDRIRIGVLVNGVLYRDPATLAKSAALVDQITGGRLEFSLGAAWAEREFQAYGLPYPDLKERYGRLEEALHIVTSLWTQDRTTFEGRYYQVHDAPCAPKPIQAPYPPIMLGGGGRGTLRMAAKYGSSWNVQGPPERVTERGVVLKELCDEVGRNIDEIEFSWHGHIAVAETHEEAEQEAAADNASHGIDEDSRQGWILGTPDEVVDQLKNYTDVGISHWIFGIGHPFETQSLRLLMDAVVPALG
jgi:F420-dependent oxidoreductase-like protein